MIGGSTRAAADEVRPVGVGAFVGTLLRILVVGVAIAVPARVLLDHRDALRFDGPVETARNERPGWAEVVLGAPSGVEPRERPAVLHALSARTLGAPTPAEDSAAEEWDEIDDPQGGWIDARPVDPRNPPRVDEDVAPPAPPPVARDFELVVEPNITLGEICSVYYGTARPKVVKAVATYNGLDDPNKLRAGRTLLLPDRSKLGLE
ncbi:MAG: hypothetical protein R3F34_20970 [Planctomycetota bacterium]